MISQDTVVLGHDSLVLCKDPVGKVVTITISVYFTVDGGLVTWMLQGEREPLSIIRKVISKVLKKIFPQLCKHDICGNL